MCIAIYKPANKTITKETLAQCFKANPDGAGFMFNHKKELYMQKGFFTFDEFWEAYEPHQDKQMAIHFRIKTHGNINVENCHPFMINKSLGFIHNGVIVGFGKDNKSDTNHFNDEIFKPLVNKYGNNILTNPSIKYLIESKIGYSKFVMLDRHGNYTLFNEDKGLWEEGIWYSNQSFRIPKPIVTNVQYLPKPKHKTIEEGELVVLITGHYEPETKTFYKTGEIFEVCHVNKDYTVDLIHEDGLRFAYNVSYVKFDFLEVADFNEFKDDVEDYTGWNTSWRT